jgi:hypothetical protein
MTTIRFLFGDDRDNDYGRRFHAALQAAGLSTSTANRYDDLTRGRDERGRDAARAAENV